MAGHPLDKPIWSALQHALKPRLARAAALARRFDPEISPFAAAVDDSAEAIAALAALIPPASDVSLLERAPPAPPAGVNLAMNTAGLQMMAQAFSAGGKSVAIEPLSDDDAAEMLALATLTRPGPFFKRTHTLGRFLGIRDGARLVAMAGERLQTDGFIEISAVCTHPDYRGRGYGGALMRAVGDQILRDGATPFLHTYANNTGAIALYRSARL